MFLSLLHCILKIFATEKCINFGVEYGLEIPATFHFYDPEKSLEQAREKQNSKDRRKLQRNCKILSKIQCIQIFYKKCLIWPAIRCVAYREANSRG